MEDNKEGSMLERLKEAVKKDLVNDYKRMGLSEEQAKQRLRFLKELAEKFNYACLHGKIGDE